LETPDKIYDYSAYYETTSAGIPLVSIASKQATNVSMGAYNVTMNASGSVWGVVGNAVTIASTTAFVGGSTMTGGVITSGNVTLNAQATRAGTYAPVIANNITLSGLANYNNLQATTAITGLNTTTVSAGGNINFGSGSSVTSSSTLSISSTALSGYLSVNNSGIQAFNFTNASGSLNLSATTPTVTARCLGTTLLSTIVAGTNVVAFRFVYITAPNIIVGSRVQLYDVTNGVELYNGILSGALNYAHTYTGDITVRLRATYQSGLTAKLPVLATGLLTASGLQFLDTQVDDTVYLDYGINGSTVTGFSADYVNTEINLNAATNFTAASLYAWWVYNTTTAQGIQNFFEGITANDAGNLQINTSIVNLYLDNTTSTFIYQTDTIRLFRTDGAYPARTVTSGGGGIDVNWKNNVYIVDAAPALTLPQFLALQNP
jgi:hypothetical protein